MRRNISANMRARINLEHKPSTGFAIPFLRKAPVHPVLKTTKLPPEMASFAQGKATPPGVCATWLFFGPRTEGKRAHQWTPNLRKWLTKWAPNQRERGPNQRERGAKPAQNGPKPARNGPKPARNGRQTSAKWAQTSVKWAPNRFFSSAHETMFLLTEGPGEMRRRNRRGRIGFADGQP